MNSKNLILMIDWANHPPINTKPRTNLFCSFHTCLKLEATGEEAIDENPLLTFAKIVCACFFIISLFVPLNPSSLVVKFGFLFSQFSPPFIYRSKRGPVYTSGQNHLTSFMNSKSLNKNNLNNSYKGYINHQK